MKMASFTTVAVLLFCCSAITVESQDKCEKYVAIGEGFTVPLNHKLRGTDRLQWKHDNRLIYDKRPDKLRTGKADDVLGDGSLKLTNLIENMSGTYTPEVYSPDGQLVKNLKSLHLCVIACVQKPKVTMECHPKPKVKFTCTSQDSSNYTWLQNGKVLNEVKEKSLLRVARDVASDSFTCQVSNQVSTSTSDPVIQTCYKGILPDKLFGLSIWIFVGGGAGIVVLLIIVVIACCVRARKKKRMRLKDEEELRLEWANPVQEQIHQYPHTPDHHHHQHHHHHHHQHQQQQQPAGHTGPRQNRSQQPRKQQRPRAPDPTNGHPQPSPRRAAQAPVPTGKADDDEQPPPLPNPRKKGPRTQKV